MSFGGSRKQVNARAQAASRPFEHFVLVQPTSFQANRSPDPDKRVELQTLYQELVGDQTRTRRICEDIVESVRNGRSPLILTERACGPVGARVRALWLDEHDFRSAVFTDQRPPGYTVNMEFNTFANY